MPDMSDRLVHKDYWDGLLVKIKDSGDYRSLYFGSGSLQSRMSLSRPHDLVLSYTQYMALPILFHSGPTKILVIGIGSGSFIRFFQYHYPECRIDAVDHSPHIIKAAKGYFQLPENSKVAIYCDDGRSFLKKNNQQQYDLILVDAFDDKGMAPTVYSASFFELCRACLAPGGIVSCNLWSNNRQLLLEIKKIISDNFDSCLYLPVPDRGNIVGLPMPFDIPWDRISIKKSELHTLSKFYSLNFIKMVKIAKQNNLTLTRRLNHLFN